MVVTELRYNLFVCCEVVRVENIHISPLDMLKSLELDEKRSKEHGDVLK